MKLTVVGCSPAWPNPGGAQSGYLVESGGTRLLLDCGPGVLPRLLERERWPRVDAIVVTHLHLDHWGDLVPWTYGVRFGTGQGAERPELWLPQGYEGDFRHLFGAVGAGELLDESFAVREYEDGATPFHVGSLELRARSAVHYDTRSYALRVSDGSATIAFSADAGPSESLVEIARDADLFLCEATLGEPESGRRGHLTAEEAIAAFRDSGARRLLVVHRPAEHPLPDGVERAVDGQVVEL